ncbi:MAG: hypothetical protein H0X17_18640 [Deltaproteobacteria bacterium]|nr:hypothetical protein [Deltaproteobacteria bacterium]
MTCAEPALLDRLKGAVQRMPRPAGVRVGFLTLSVKPRRIRADDVVTSRMPQLSSTLR